jgi:hypothetical protein
MFAQLGIQERNEFRRSLEALYHERDPFFLDALAN